MSTTKTPQENFQTNKDNEEIAPESSKIQQVIHTSGDHKEELLLEQIITKERETDEELLTKEKETDDEEETTTGLSSRNAEVSENNDGFKTPTSPRNRIPSQVQCPPAPRKLLPPKLKRKGSSSPVACRRLQFEETEDVEAIFRALSGQDNVEETKNKKVRRKEEDCD